METRLRPREPKLLPLFQAIAADRHNLWLGDRDAAQIDWILENGLGPACFRAARRNRQNAILPFWDCLRAADVTARITAADQTAAVVEMIDAAAAAAVERVTLLKGISIAAECYPEFHLRPMRDIDVLVEEHDLARMTGLLYDLGYRQKCGGLAAVYASHHHLEPFFHQEKNICVEVHHHLLSSKNRASRDPVFGLANIRAQTRASVFYGRPVHRLSPELQIVYLSAHWAQHLKTIGGMIAALDVIHLLRHAGASFRWDSVFQWVQGSAAANSLGVLLSYLDRRSLIRLPDGIRPQISDVERRAGAWSLKAAHVMIDRYLLDGRNFGVALNERNLSIAWTTLMLPFAPTWKLLLLPFNLSLPSRVRVQ